MSQSDRSSLTRTLPEKPNLSQLKKQAKELRKAFQTGESEAVALVREHYPLPSSNQDSESFQLSDAQLVLARSYGFESWPKLKAFVEGVTIVRFIAAVQWGDTKRVADMLLQRPELVHMDTSEGNEHRGLHHAVLRRDVAMVRILMKAGADARKGIWPHRDATTALALAKEHDYPDIVAVIEEEEQHRRSEMSCPNSTVSPVQDQINLAIREGDSAAALRLLEADHSLINACDRDGGTPLHVAAQMANVQLVEWLLSRRASARKLDIKGLTPIDRAALAAHPPHDRAQRFPAVAKLLIDHGAEVTLRAAVALADARHVRELVSAAPGILRMDIHWPSGGLLTLAVKYGHLEIVRLLLDLGADVDESNFLREVEEPTVSWGAPLWYAAMSGQLDIAELLLDRGADPNANLYASGWPLQRAYQRNDEAMMRLLLARGARPQPYMVAEAHDVAEARRLLEGNSSEELANELAWSAADQGCPAIVELALACLKWSSADLRWYWILIQPVRGVGNDQGAGPVVATQQRLECLRIMMRHGIDPNVPRLGQTALHFTLARAGIENESERTPFAEMLLDEGARVDLRDDLLQSTALGWACRWGRKEIVELLVNRGAPVNEPDAEPWATPLAWAKKMGHAEIERMLCDLGAKA